jgi:hypothetical protein
MKIRHQTIFFKPSGFACFSSMFISATKLAYIFSKSIKDFSPIDLGMHCSSRASWCHLLYKDSRPQVKIKYELN